MNSSISLKAGNVRKRRDRIDAVAEWRGRLTGVTAALLAYEILTGLSIYLLPFSLFNQFGVITHTLVGLAMVLPAGWFLARHWWVRRKGRLSHFQLLGYISLVVLLVCTVSGLILTWQSVIGTRIDYMWDQIHLLTGLGLGLFVVIHLVTVVMRKLGPGQSARSLRRARHVFYAHTVLGGVLFAAVCGLWAFVYEEPSLIRGFADDYNWRFGEDRPFAPSLARLDTSGWLDDVQEQVLEVLDDDQRASYLSAFDKNKRGTAGPFERIRRSLAELNPSVDQTRKLEPVFRAAAQRIKTAGSVDPRALAGSEACGSSGCHNQIYKEWLPSAHRYSSMDDMFQRVQALMVDETAPEYTRYCAGCHDPISLFSGAKNAGDITLSAEGANEGSSCLVCHSIVQADIQGNGDYTIRPARRYAYELREGTAAKFISDFLIRSYPEQHIRSFSRPLYKTPEFCAACHKQYIDKEVNIDIGKVQGQNQYDSWKNSRWYHEGSQQARTVSCRECHMPLIESADPARGDASDYNRNPADGRHRSHRTLAANQYIPVVHNLEGADQHVALTEQWLRGELEIPEIAEKWTTGPVIRMKVLAPKAVSPGQDVRLQVLLTNNKTGHDYPTGPLDMLESWVELQVTDEAGNLIYHTGGLDGKDRVDNTTLSYRADGFDRKGKLIDRHNLWDLVGASYKRTLYPGMTDTVEARFQCPDMARERVAADGAGSGTPQRTESFSFTTPATTAKDQLAVSAVLWYRKANPDFLDRIYGEKLHMRSPRTAITEAGATIEVIPEAHASAH